MITREAAERALALLLHTQVRTVPFHGCPANTMIAATSAAIIPQHITCDAISHQLASSQTWPAGARITTPASTSETPEP